MMREKTDRQVAVCFFAGQAAGQLCAAVVVGFVDNHAVRCRCVCQGNDGSGLVHGRFRSGHELRGFGNLTAGDQLPEFNSLDLRFDGDGAASLAGELDALGMAFSAVGEYGLPGQLGCADVGEIQIEKRLLGGVVHEKKIADLSVCHVSVCHDVFLLWML